ncbi:hypothetical protein MNV49_006652 [Pseudohyphozyma bogoriensis]|nr:hypothetical protein MNV49_006652 [Pseudohyphozyma bogoriensis]
MASVPSNTIHEQLWLKSSLALASLPECPTEQQIASLLASIPWTGWTTASGERPFTHTFVDRPEPGASLVCFLHPPTRNPPPDGVRYLPSAPTETVSHSGPLVVQCPTSLAAPTTPSQVTCILTCYTTSLGHLPPHSRSAPLPPDSLDRKLTRYRKRYHISRGAGVPGLFFVYFGKTTDPDPPPILDGWDQEPSRAYPLPFADVPTHPVFIFGGRDRPASFPGAQLPGAPTPPPNPLPLLDPFPSSPTPNPSPSPTMMSTGQPPAPSSQQQRMAQQQYLQAQAAQAAYAQALAGGPGGQNPMMAGGVPPGGPGSAYALQQQHYMQAQQNQQRQMMAAAAQQQQQQAQMMRASQAAQMQQAQAQAHAAQAHAAQVQKMEDIHSSMGDIFDLVTARQLAMNRFSKNHDTFSGVLDPLNVREILEKGASGGKHASKRKVGELGELAVTFITAGEKEKDKDKDKDKDKESEGQVEKKTRTVEERRDALLKMKERLEEEARESEERFQRRVESITKAPVAVVVPPVKGPRSLVVPRSSAVLASPAQLVQLAAGLERVARMDYSLDPLLSMQASSLNPFLAPALAPPQSAQHAHQHQHQHPHEPGPSGSHAGHSAQGHGQHVSFDDVYSDWINTSTATAFQPAAHQLAPSDLHLKHLDHPPPHTPIPLPYSSTQPYPAQHFLHEQSSSSQTLQNGLPAPAAMAQFGVDSGLLANLLASDNSTAGSHPSPFAVPAQTHQGSPPASSHFPYHPYPTRQAPQPSAAAAPSPNFSLSTLATASTAHAHPQPRRRLQSHAQPPQSSSVQPHHSPPSQSRSPKSSAPSGGTGGKNASAQPLHRTPPAHDHSPREAADLLLRLALPTGSTGSVTTNTSAGDDDEGDASCDEDAEGEPESDATSVSVHDDDVSKYVGAGWEQVERGRGKGSRRPSIASSIASARVRQHRPARTQREQSASAASRAGSDGGRPVGRRTSGRVRKTIVKDTSALFEDESDGDSVGEDDTLLDSPEEDDDDDETSTSARKKGKGKAKASSMKGKAASAAKGKAKRDGGAGPSNPAPAKKPRVSNSEAIITPGPPRPPRRQAAPVVVPSRTFPPEIEMDLVKFPRFYRTFPVSSAFPPDSHIHRLAITPAGEGSSAAASTSTSTSRDGQQLPWGVAGSSALQFSSIHPPPPAIAQTPMMTPPVDSKWHKSCDPFNLYNPRFVKGAAEEKMGLCPICVEGVARGGEGVERWLKLKNSSYVYHMSYAHGLSNLTGKPFSPPVKLRTIPVKPTNKDARDHMTQGLCHKCDKWIPLLSVKNVDAVVPELIWWKHAKPCHGQSTIEGECDIYHHDDILDLVNSRRAGIGANAASASTSAAPTASTSA